MQGAEAEGVVSDETPNGLPPARTSAQQRPARNNAAMANTSALQAAIEWVRSDLAARTGVAFVKARVRFTIGGTWTFNAVAADKSVVATVMNSSGATSGGKKPVGKLRGAIAELYFLSLVEAPRRALVVTNRNFLQYLERELEGALSDGLEILLITLPEDLAAAVAGVTEAASDEMS